MSLTRPVPPLATRRAELAAAEPRLYPRDLAARLGVTEAELVALDEGASTIRLRPDWMALLGQLESLGEVMALTRNSDAVHEKTGVYGAPEGSSLVALFVGEAIDLRLFLRQWSAAWAVEAGGRRSLQIYGDDGAAIHKIYATPATDLAAWNALVARFAVTLPNFTPVAPAPEPAARPDEAIDVAGLQAAWDALRDTHHFHALLGRFGVTRVQGLRLAGAARARMVDRASLRTVLEHAAGTGLPIMVFVGNAGCIQIHTGPVHRLVATGDWFNVLDPGFNLHLRETAVASTWVVHKPTDDGVVTSLELFDAEGRQIAALFGARKPGQAQLPAWQALCDGLAGA